MHFKDNNDEEEQGLMQKKKKNKVIVSDQPGFVIKNSSYNSDSYSSSNNEKANLLVAQKLVLVDMNNVTDESGINIIGKATSKSVKIFGASQKFRSSLKFSSNMTKALVTSRLTKTEKYKDMELDIASFAFVDELTIDLLSLECPSIHAAVSSKYFWHIALVAFTCYFYDYLLNGIWKIYGNEKIEGVDDQLFVKIMMICAICSSLARISTGKILQGMSYKVF